MGTRLKTKIPDMSMLPMLKIQEKLKSMKNILTVKYFVNFPVDVPNVQSSKCVSYYGSGRSKWQFHLI